MTPPTSSAAILSLNLAHAPVAVAFLAEAPTGMQRIDHADAASCGYWKRASEGQSFYTAPEDHQNCPIGAFTHGVALSPAKTDELHGLIGTMVELKYLKGEEIPQIPHRTQTLEVAAYAPLEHATFAPDLVIFRGNVRQIMLVSEAARRADALDAGAVMGRPACSMLPQALQGEKSVTSVGCIGNRVYTGLSDDEMYFTVPGAMIDRVVDELATVVNANNELEKFHQDRKARLTHADV